MKIIFVTIISIFISSMSFAETDKVMKPAELKELSQKHEKWMKSEFQTFRVDVSKLEKAEQKMQKLDSFRKAITEYFKQNQEQMETKLRLEFRSFLNLYVGALPLAKYYRKKNCPQYWSLFRASYMNRPDQKTWTAGELENFLVQVCPRELPVEEEEQH